jgi:hypothetical protein
MAVLPAYPGSTVTNVLRKDLSFVSVSNENIPAYFSLKKTPVLFPRMLPSDFSNLSDPGYYTPAYDTREEYEAVALSRIRELCADKPVERTPGYVISTRARVGVRAAGQALFLNLFNNVSYSPYFITLTFPDIPGDILPGESSIPYQERDRFCHDLFKRFIRYEKTRHGLNSYVWVNERQSGERGGTSRGYTHYHIVCLYDDMVDYRYINLRWLRLLHGEGLQVFSEYAPEDEGFRRDVMSSLQSASYSRLREVYHVYDSDRRRHSIFRCPLDITPVKWSENDHMKVINYLLKYISKDCDERIYCRRWGYSVNLRVNKDAFDELVERFNIERVDMDTGEVQREFSAEIYHKVFGSPPVYRGDGMLMFSVCISHGLPPDVLRLVYRYFNIPFDPPDIMKNECFSGEAATPIFGSKTENAEKL